MIDIVFSDLQMPIMNGDVVVANIRSFEFKNKLKETPIIIMSAATDKKDYSLAYKNGASGHLFKPIRKKNILDKINLLTSNNCKKELITWSKYFEVGEVKIDVQHKYLVELINIWHNFCNSSEESLNAFKKVEKYIINHFSYEEKMLEKYAYPDLENHKLKHKLFVKQIEDFKTDFESKKIDLPALSLFLKNWFVHHILSEDMDYASFIKNSSKAF